MSSQTDGSGTRRERVHPSESGYFAQVYALVRQVPPGRVVTYGQIAAALGDPRRARVVGWAMRACPKDVPWHRVVNARGELSLGPAHGGVNLQRALLEDEGIHFDARARIDLQACSWQLPTGDG
jgi:methylated-DNA-protein-cysteine methyltransferase-like protein